MYKIVFTIRDVSFREQSYHSDMSLLQKILEAECNFVNW